MNKIFQYVVNLFSSKSNKVILKIGFLNLLLYSSLQISFIRSIVIDLTELLLGRSISFDYWNSQLIHRSVYLLIPFAFIFLVFIFDIYNQLPRISSFIERSLSNHKWIKTIVVLIPWLTIIVLFCVGNISDPDFWFDESGQFWLAKGLNHYSEPYSDVGNFADIIHDNREFNLDPGGFTFLLYLWTQIDNSPLFLRLLPVSFFILSMVLVSKLSLIWYPNKLLSYFAGFILLFSSLIKYYAFELRPYSMEMFTALLALYLCYKIPQILTDRRAAIIAGLSMAVFLTSRYTAFLSIGTLGFITFYELIFNFRSKRSIINFIYFISPILISALSVYFFMLQYQNPGGIPPTYVNDLMLSTGSIEDILFNLEAVKIYSPFLVLISFFILNSKNRSLDHFGKFISYSLILNIIFMILSLMGKHPWSFITKWDISSHVILLLSILPILFFTIKHFDRVLKLNRWAQVFITFGFLVTSGIIANKYHYSGFGSIYDNFTECHVTANENARVVATGYASPTIRYLFEYGPLKEYEQHYRNLSIQSATEGITKNLDINEYDYIILPHWVNESNEIIQIMENSHTWEICSRNKYSQMYENNKNN